MKILKRSIWSLCVPEEILDHKIIAVKLRFSTRLPRQRHPKYLIIPLKSYLCKLVNDFIDETNKTEFD
jgi:hypothetical protein